MAYVEKDAHGAMLGVYANPQPSNPNVVHVADDDPLLVAFMATASAPKQVAMWQARAVLGISGKLTAVQAAIDASANPVWKAAWEYGTTVDRSSEMIAGLGAAVGLTSAQIDALFVQAVGMTA